MGKIGIGTTTPASKFSVVAGMAPAVILGRNTGAGPGVQGKSVSGYGVQGISTSDDGVQGTSSGGYGGYFTSTSSYGGNFSSSSNDAADFSGNDWGIYVRNSGGNPAVDGGSFANSSYGGMFKSSAYRGGFFQSGGGYYDLVVDSGNTGDGLYVTGDALVAGNLVVGGSKTGYVVDHMQNADSVALEAGDVVVIADDSSEAVLGEIPTPRIRRATSENDSAVVGVVDKVTYVPDLATRQAYEAQQQADRDAGAQSRVAEAAGQKLASTANIPNRITDRDGALRIDDQTKSVASGGYCSVVTLGAYKAVKVDASFGAIKAGDLLTTSSHAGYAMRVKDKALASGAIVGKALSSLSSGSGTVTVLVTLK